MRSQSAGRIRAITSIPSRPPGLITAISPSARYGGPATAKNGLPWLEIATLVPLGGAVLTSVCKAS